MEGFERYLETLFGPGGKANVIKDKMEEYKMRWIRQTDENDLIESKVQEIADIARNIKEEPKVSENNILIFYAILEFHLVPL